MLEKGGGQRAEGRERRAKGEEQGARGRSRKSEVGRKSAIVNL